MWVSSSRVHVDVDVDPVQTSSSLAASGYQVVRSGEGEGLRTGCSVAIVVESCMTC